MLYVVNIMLGDAIVRATLHSAELHMLIKFASIYCPNYVDLMITGNISTNMVATGVAICTHNFWESFRGSKIYKDKLVFARASLINYMYS